MDNLALAQQIFQPGNEHTLVDHLAEDVVLSTTIPDRPPRAAVLRGREAVVAYFESLDELGEFDPFAGPLDFLADAAGDRIAVLGEMRFRVAASGAAGCGAYAFVMHFRDGRIARIVDLMELSAVADPLE